MTDYTPILNLPQVAPNQNQKEATINTALAILEAAMNDTTLVSAASGSLTLTTDIFTKYFLIQVGGFSAAASLIVPATPRWFAVENMGSAALTVQTLQPAGSPAGTPLTVQAGKIALVVSDGVDLRTLLPDPSGGTGILEDLSNVKSGATDGQFLRYVGADALWEPYTLPTLVEQFTQLTDVPQSYTAMKGMLVGVNDSEDGLIFISANNNIHNFDQLDDVPNSYDNAGGYLLRVKADSSGIEFAIPKLADFGDVPDYSKSAGELVAIALDGSGLTYRKAAVADLIDGPGSASTKTALQYVRVKQDGSGLEYAAGTSGPDKLIELVDGPQSYSGAAGAFVQVNQGADGFIFAKPSFVSLGDAPTSYTNAAGYFVKVNANANGLIFAEPKMADLGDGPGAPASKALQVVRVNAAATALEYHAMALTDLSGLPNSYAGAGGKFLQVKPDGSGVQFAASSLTTAFTALTDAPQSYTGKGGYLVQVNPGATALQFINPTSVGVTTLAALTDVDESTAPADGQALVYSATEKKWKPASVDTALPSLEELTDVAIPSTPDDGMSLVWVAADSKWEARSIVGQSGSQAGKHQYWRILILANQGAQQTSFASVQFRDPSGTNLSTVGADAFASSQYDNNSVAAYAFDTSLSTSWRSTAADYTGGAAEVGYNFGKAVAIQSVQLTASGYTGEAPSHFQVQYSDDNSTWATALDREVTSWAAGTTNIYLVQAYQVTEFLQLTDAPASYTGQAGQGVRVNAAATGLEFYNPAQAVAVQSAGSSLTTSASLFNFTGSGVQASASGGVVTINVPVPALSSLTDVDETTAPTDGQALIYSLSEKKWKPGTPNGSGASTFTQLNDAPQSYTGAASKVVRVNAGATALEFHAPAVADLSDGPGAPVTANAGKAVRLNAAGTAQEYYTPPSVPTTLGALSDVTDSDTAPDGYVLTFHNNKWQAMASQSAAGEVTGSTPNFGAHSYWKAVFLAEADATGTYIDIAELQFRTAKGGASVATGGTPSSTYASPYNPASNAFDGSAASYASNLGDFAQLDLSYEFTAPVNIVEVAIQVTSAATHTPKNFAVYYSDDSANWTPAFAVVGETNWSGSELRSYSPAPRVTQFRDLNDVPNAYPNDGSILAANADGSGLHFVAAPPRSFVNLSDVPASYANAAHYYVRVNSATNALEFAPFPALVNALAGLSDVDETTAPTDGQVLRYKGSESKWVPSPDQPLLITLDEGSALNSVTKTINFVGGAVQASDDGSGNVTVTVAAADSGAVVFTALEDVPNSYANKGGQTVRVNAAATGLEFYSAPVTLATQGDADITSPDERDLLIYKNGKWTNLDQRDVLVADPYGAHAYWRLRVIEAVDTTDEYVDIFEIEFHASLGGPNIATGGTPIGTTNGGYAPALAFDGEETTRWAATPPANSGTSYVGYQFASPVRVAEVLVSCQNAYPVASFAVEYSDDSNTWTQAWLVAGQSGWSTAPRTFHGAATGLSILLSDFSDGPGATSGSPGKVMTVRPDGTGYELVAPTLKSDTDVVFSQLSDGQVLTYDADTQTWVNQSIPTVTPKTVNYGPHANWRIILTSATVQGAAGLAELVFAASTGGTQQATGGTATASSYYDTGYTPDKAFDGDVTTFWSSFQVSKDQWLAYEFAAPVKVAEVRMTARPDSNYTQAPVDFSVQYSDDGTTWYDAWDASAVAWTAAGQVQTFDAPLEPTLRVELAQLDDVDESASPLDGQVLAFSQAEGKWKPTTITTSGSAASQPQSYGAHTYWRVLCDTAAADPIALSTVAFAATAGGAQEATGGTALSSSVYNSQYVAANAFDSDPTTIWAASTQTNEWIGYQFASPVSVAEVRLTSRSDGNYTQAPTAVHIQYSDDGSTWTTAWTPTLASWSEGMTQNLDAPSEPNSATLAALTDVDESTAPTDGQVLTFIQSENKWKPVTPAAGGSGGSSGSFKSTWSSSGVYAYGDSVSYSGRLWTCLSGATTSTPGTDNTWGATGLDRSYDYWNEFDAGVSCFKLLSDGRTVDDSAANDSWQQIRGSKTYTSGKVYWEIAVLQGPGSDGFTGASSPGTNVNTYPGNGSGFGRGYDGNTISGIGGSTTNGSGWSTGDVIGFALDFAAGAVTVYHNNVSDGGVTGMTMPSSGLNIAQGFRVSNNIRVKLCTTTSACKYTPPTGFSYWG